MRILETPLLRITRASVRHDLVRTYCKMTVISAKQKMRGTNHEVMIFFKGKKVF